YYQPIRKGGAVLVKFFVDIAKKSELCPIGVVQADIVKLIRGKFIIPDGKIYNNAMLKHVGKHRRQWKFELKAKYFNPTVRTKQQIENDNPGAIVQGTWLELVKYWYSGQSKKYADNGREARAMLSHLHTNGSTSFTNSRDEFDIKHGREPCGYEFFDRTHKTKDGVYPENTNTQELIDMEKSKIDATVASSSSTKPRMRHNKETTNLIMRLSSSVSDLLTAMQSGRVSPETLAATNSALSTITAQNEEDLSEDGDESDHSHLLDELEDIRL
ncbi:hypothetical protein RDABS01_031884, partial [Bienertia sinuspersici]